MDDTVDFPDLEELSLLSPALLGRGPVLGPEPLLAPDINSPSATADPSAVATGPGGIGRSLDAERPEQPTEPQAESDTSVIEPPVPALDQPASRPPPRPSEPCAEDSPAATFGRRRRLVAITAIISVAVLLVGGLAFRSNGKGLPAHAAFKVDGHVVTVDALQRRVHVLGALYGVTPPTDSKGLDAFRRDTAKALVLSIVMTDAAHQKGVAIANKVVVDDMNAIISQRYGQGGRADFVKALAVQGISETDVSAEVRRQLEVRQLYDQVTSGVSVSETAARKDYLANPATYQPAQKRHLRELVVADQAHAVNILAKIRAGADFATLAKAESLDASTRTSGGDLGTVAASTLDPSFSGPAFATAEGTAFGPVHTSLGWYVGLVVSIEQAPLPSFDAVKTQVQQQLANLAQLKTWRTFLQGKLNEGAAHYRSEYKPSAPNALPTSDLAPAAADNKRP
jgi:peptidyl-prolyl cis-trans isomerase C